MNKYEAMFVLDPSMASNWETGEAEVRRLLERASAQVLKLIKWDERRLAYDIKRRKRGVYALAFFEAPGDKIVDLERDATISEMVLRLLVLRHESITPETIERATAAVPAARSAERSGEPSRGPRERWRDKERRKGKEPSARKRPTEAQTEGGVLEQAVSSDPEPAESGVLEPAETTAAQEVGDAGRTTDPPPAGVSGPDAEA